MSIFDDISREGIDPPNRDEALFAYLNRSNRIEAARVRQLVDGWFDHYPANHREGLIARFRSVIDDQHKSAFFELLLHELVLASGNKVVAIEPRLEHTTKSPDFFVESARGERFYLEAVVATGRSKDDTAAQARLNQALAAIDKISSPDHFLDLTVHKTPSAPLSINKLKRGLQTWIAALPDDARAKDAASFVFEEHGVRISVRAWPRQKREDGGRAIRRQTFSRSKGVSGRGRPYRAEEEGDPVWRSRSPFCGGA